MVISGEDVYSSVVFATLAGVYVFSVMCSDLLMTYAISCPVWSSVYERQRAEFAFTPPVRTECGMFVMLCDVMYVVFYGHVSCFVVHSCAVSMRYIDVYNCDVFTAANMYLDHLNFCVVCIYGRRYVCCSECNVVSEECDEPTFCLVQPVGAHGGEVMYF